MEGIKNYKYYISYICLALSAFSFRVSLADASSVIVEENVSATVNTGGNVVEGGGEIKTGNASASSSTSTTVKGGGESETKVEVKASAEANGKKVEAEVKEENPKENISVRKEIREEGAEAEVSVDIETDPSGEDGDEAGSEMPAGAEQQELDDPEPEKKSLFFRTAESVSSAVKNIFDKLISFFG